MIISLGNCESFENLISNIVNYPKVECYFKQLNHDCFLLQLEDIKNLVREQQPVVTLPSFVPPPVYMVHVNVKRIITTTQITIPATHVGVYY